MSWPIRLIEPPARDEESLEYRCAVGDAWHASRGEDGQWYSHPEGTPWPTRWGPLHLSPEYHRDNARRPPLIVRFPGRRVFCVDEVVVTDGGYGTNGWQVSGEVPHITVSPSINLIGDYHGWIRDGVITDDCEGRMF